MLQKAGYDPQKRWQRETMNRGSESQAAWTGSWDPPWPPPPGPRGGRPAKITGEFTGEPVRMGKWVRR